MKFIKFLSNGYLNNNNYSLIKLSNDSYNKYSFYFDIYRNDKYISNGGLIYHANSETSVKIPKKTINERGTYNWFQERIIKGYYGIHT